MPELSIPNPAQRTLCPLIKSINVTMDTLLKSVSRTFYLSIHRLPADMRAGVSVGYLLARATDSVADAKLIPHADRTATLIAMQKAIAESADACPIPAAICAAADTPAEVALLTRFNEALQALSKLPQQQASLVRDVLSSILQGQLWDLSFFEEHSRVLSDEQTRLYTYRVAGCVGRFWTRLGRATLGDDFCTAEEADDMEEAAIRYGCGLQLINILRDRDEDARTRGREYLCSDPQVWMKRAERAMQDGLEYARRLRGWRVRVASMLPALLGLKTLAKLRRAKPGKKVKISRLAVFGSILRAILAAL